MNIRSTKRQKSLTIHFGKESKNETLGAGEDFTGVPGVTMEYPTKCYDITELILINYLN